MCEGGRGDLAEIVSLKMSIAKTATMIASQTPGITVSRTAAAPAFFTSSRSSSRPPRLLRGGGVDTGRWVDTGGGSNGGGSNG